MQCFLWARTMGQFFCSAALVFGKGKGKKKRLKHHIALQATAGAAVLFLGQKNDAGGNGVTSDLPSSGLC